MGVGGTRRGGTITQHDCRGDGVVWGFALYACVRRRRVASRRVACVAHSERYLARAAATSTLLGAGQTAVLVAKHSARPIERQRHRQPRIREVALLLAHRPKQALRLPPDASARQEKRA